MSSKKESDIGLIASVNGRASFVKAVDFAFNIHRVCLRFVRYDNKQNKGSKVQGEVIIYIDFADMLRLINLTVHNPYYLKQVKYNLLDAQRKGMQYPKPIILHRGGTSAEKLAQKGKARSDGKGESRILQIAPGIRSKDYPYSLEAVLAPGKKVNNGIIAPDGKPELTVRVPFSVDSLENFLLSIENAINGYTSAVYMYRLLYPERDIPTLLSDYSKQQNTAHSAQQQPIQEAPQYCPQGTYVQPPQIVPFGYSAY